jgi:hypothetical protein
MDWRYCLDDDVVDGSGILDTHKPHHEARPIITGSRIKPIHLCKPDPR